MKNVFQHITAKMAVLPVLFIPTAVSAQAVEAYEELGRVAKAANVSDSQYNLPLYLGALINAVISLLGIVFVVLMVYAGFLYMTASGEEEKVKKAKKLITQAIIGLVIITSAYAVSLFVFDLLASAANTEGG